MSKNKAHRKGKSASHPETPAAPSPTPTVEEHSAEAEAEPYPNMRERRIGEDKNCRPIRVGDVIEEDNADVGEVTVIQADALLYRSNEQAGGISMAMCYECEVKSDGTIASDLAGLSKFAPRRMLPLMIKVEHLRFELEEIQKELVDEGDIRDVETAIKNICQGDGASAISNLFDQYLTCEPNLRPAAAQPTAE